MATPARAFDPSISADAMPYPSAARAWSALAVLSIAYMFSFIDRFVLSLMVEPIKRDLALSDLQISLLQGLSFALFYTLAGLPVGRLVDSRSRIGIVAVGVAVWSLMTAACGLASRFWHLFLARIGVGVGEAALVPAAYSLITDFFPKQRHGLAMSVFSLGTSLGAGLAFIVGGYAIQLITAAGSRTFPIVGTLDPWQLTFVYVGLPGLAVAALALLVGEPPRRGDVNAQSIPIKEVLAHFRKRARVITLHHISMGLAGIGTFAMMSWTPTMLIRTRGWTPGEAGLALGGAILIAGTIGVVAAGWIGDRLVQRGRAHGQLMVCALAMAIGAVGAATFPIQQSTPWLLAAFLLAMLGGYMIVGCSAAALQQLVPNRMRGQASAVYLLVTNLIGLGFGPTVVALLTEHVFRDPAALPWSLAISAGTAYVASLIGFLSVLRPFERTVQAEQGTAA
jgi:MFS family permease